MLDCVKKLQHLQHWKNHIKSLFVARFIGISMVTWHKQATYMLPSFINRTENHSFRCHLSRAVTFLPIVFLIAIWVGCRVEHLPSALTNVGIELALAFIKHDDACTITKMIVLRVTTRKAAMRQEYMVIHQ